MLLLLCFVTHWFSPHHRHYYQQQWQHLSSSHPLKKRSWLSLGGHYACSWSGSLGFLELFSNSPFECLWPLFIWYIHLPGLLGSHLFWVDSSLMAPLELALFWISFWPPPHGSPASPPHYARTIWSWRTQFRQSLWLSCRFSPEALFRMVNALSYCSFIIYLLHLLFQWFLFCFDLNILCSTISFVDWWRLLLIIQFIVPSNTGNVSQVFWSC